MRETKEQRNARLLKTLSGNYVSGVVAWNMVRELKADQVMLFVNEMLIQPQRQDLMWNLNRSPESCWGAYSADGRTLSLTPQLYDEPHFKKWSDVVSAAKPAKPVLKTEMQLDQMAEEMLDDMTHEDMVNWALSRNINFDDESSDRTAQTFDIIAAVGTDGWAQFFNAKVVEEE